MSSINQILKIAIEAIRAGDKKRGEDLLNKVLQTAPHNETALLWLASIMDDKVKRRKYLEDIVALNPNNQHALKGLSQLAHEEEGVIASQNNHTQIFEQDRKIEYFEHQVMPWLLAHLEMRNTGLQVFVAIQGGLLVASATSREGILTVLGLASCISFLAWDARNVIIFESLHRMGEKLVDKPIFGLGEDHRAKGGLHKEALDRLQNRQLWFSKGGRESIIFTHTFAIRLMIGIAALVWITQVATV